MSADPFAPLSPGSNAAAESAPKRVAILPVPADAPAAPAEHLSLGAPSQRWTYRNSARELLGYVCRFDGPDGKQFRPLVLFKDAARGSIAWRWESWPAPRPLYGLDRLAARPSAPVIVCEGEKAADAAAALLPEHVAIASPNGSKSAGKADWTALAGRHVTIWPDADAAGAEYAATVCKVLSAAGALSTKIAAPPPDAAEGWDAADALTSGWTETRGREFIAAAVAPSKSEKTGSGGGHDRRPPQRDSLIGLTDDFELWCDADGVAYATFPVKDRVESWPVRSKRFKSLLAGSFFLRTGQTIGGQALEDGLRVLEANAMIGGLEFEPLRRVGQHEDDVYIDLCDANWRAIKVAADGWTIVGNPPVKLLRSAAMRPLPEPEAGSEINLLRRYANMGDDDFVLVAAWLVAALWPTGPYPIMVIAGEQGAGKSFFTRLIRALIDPSSAPIRTPSRDERDLVVQAYNSRVIALDNLSSVPAFLADGLCRLATGGGFSTRQLHTDLDEIVIDAARPIMLNGIPLLTERADLAERTMTINLRTIPQTERKPEALMLREFEADRPKILGVLLDGVASAIRRLPGTHLHTLPRMADFARLAVAAMPGLGFEPEDFLRAYDANRRDAVEATFEANIVAVAVMAYVNQAHPTGWSGTATELLAALNERVPESVRRSRAWPFKPQSLGNEIKRVAPLLRQKGLAVEKRHSGDRMISIVPMPSTAVPPLAPDEDPVSV